MSKSSAKELREMFPDWKELKPGNWSKAGRIIECTSGKKVEIGLYREPEENPEYAGRYTLQVFLGDDVVIAEDVELDG